MDIGRLLERLRSSFHDPTPAGPNVSAHEHRLPLVWAILVVVGSYYILAASIITGVMSKTILEGESAVLSNAVIEYATKGELRYPLHAHDLFYPGVKVFMLHPPLHYVYVAQWVKAFGVGTLQLTLPSALLALLGIGLATVLVYRLWGFVAAALTPLMAALHLNFYDPSLSLRCDIMLGFMMLIFTVVLGTYLLGPPVRWRQATLAFLVGLSAVGCLAAHWLGAFTALPACAFLVVTVRRRTWRVDVPAAAIGVGTGFLFWYGLYGEDLWRSLLFVPLQGAQFHEVLPYIPRSRFLQPFVGMDGGLPVLVGIALAVVLVAGRLYAARSAAAGSGTGAPALALSDKACLLLISMCGAYMLFLVFVVANRDPRYLINIYFLMLPLSAVGYAMGWQYLGRLVGLLGPVGSNGGRAWVIVSLIAASLSLPLSAWASPVISRYFTLNPFMLPNPNAVYAETHAKLRRVTLTDAPTLMGGGAYYFLYDVPLVSSYRIMSAIFLEPINDDSFFKVLRRHFAQRGNLKPSEATSQQLRDGTVVAAEVMVMTDDCHSYQCRFYDPDVWRSDYYKVGTVLNVDVWRTGRRPPILKPTYEFLTVYFRKDVAEHYLDRLGITRGDISFANGIGFLVYKPRTAAGTEVTEQAWRLVPYGGKRRAMVSRYLEAQDDFGLSLDRASRETLLDLLLPKVNKAFARPYTRTLDQAIDRAFLFPAVWEHLNRVRGRDGSDTRRVAVGRSARGFDRKADDGF